MTISLHSLTKCYHRNKQHAICELTLAIPPGSVFALMGRNGAGKTTTLQLIMNLLEPTSGESFVFGVPSSRLNPEHRQRIGYISENQKLPQWMRVDQFLQFLKPMYPTWDDRFAQRMMRLFELPMNALLPQLSRGERMKLAFLGALAYRPDLLILDEPFSGLDSVLRQDLLDVIIEYLGDGERTVLLSSHDLDETERLADTIGVLHQSRLGLTGSVDDLLSRAREVSFASQVSNPAVPAGLPSTWWNCVSSPHGTTFVASHVADDQDLIAQVLASWPDATAITMHRPGLRRFYIDYLRHHTPSATPEISPNF